MKKIFILIFSLACALFTSLNSVINKDIIVFVHGTTLPFTCFLDPISLLKGRVREHSWYRSANLSLRNYDWLTAHSGVQLGQGLIAIPSQLLNNYHPSALTSKDRSFAAYHTLYAYHEFGIACGAFRRPVDLYCFGWSGLLDHHERIAAGNELYAQLTKLRARYDADARITIVAYSYGGQVALHMTTAHQKSAQKLTVDQLVLYGTPLQNSVIPLVSSNLFSKVLNFYSHGDKIQIADFVSNGRQKNVRSFRELGITQPSILDIALAVNGNPRIFDHRGFCMMAYNNQPIASLRELPFVVMLPVWTKMCEQLTTEKQVQLVLNVEDDFRNGILRSKLMCPSNSHIFACSPNLYKAAQQVSQNIEPVWDSSQNIFKQADRLKNSLTKPFVVLKENLGKLVGKKTSLLTQKA